MAQPLKQGELGNTHNEQGQSSDTLREISVHKPNPTALNRKVFASAVIALARPYLQL